VETFMKAVVGLTVALLSSPLAAQETKPVPKDSARVTVPGCSRRYIFTVGPRTTEQPGSSFEIPEGMHLRMSGPKKVIEEIKAHEGSMIEITGLMKKGQYKPDGVSLGGGVRIGQPSSSPTGGQVVIDVEGWRPAVGTCPAQ
jgi:hypothetical protein